MNSWSDYVKKYLIVDGVKCGRHCSRPVTFALLSEDPVEITGAYVDPDMYVSRVVYFSLEPNLEWFTNTLRAQVGAKLNEKDLRFATRHGWEFGRQGEKDARTIFGSNAKGITEYYWTFYPKTDEDKKTETYLCSKAHGGCGKRIFVRSVGDDEKLCDLCRA